MNKGKCNWNCCNSNNKGFGNTNLNQWGCCEQNYKQDEQNGNFCCFWCECEKKQEEKRPNQKHCSCQCKQEEKEMCGCSFSNGCWGKDYGYDYEQKNYGYNNY